MEYPEGNKMNSHFFFTFFPPVQRSLLKNKAQKFSHRYRSFSPLLFTNQTIQNDLPVNKNKKTWLMRYESEKIMGVKVKSE